MAAFPLALPGAALGLFITHNPFGFTAFIGVISLGGLVVRNSIILVDYIHERMKHGIASGGGDSRGRRAEAAPDLPDHHGSRRRSDSDDHLPLQHVVPAGKRDCLRPARLHVLYAGRHSGLVRGGEYEESLQAGSRRGCSRRAPVCVRYSQPGTSSSSITLDESLQLAMKKNSSVSNRGTEGQGGRRQGSSGESQLFSGGNKPDQRNSCQSKTDSLTIPTRNTRNVPWHRTTPGNRCEDSAR